MQSGKKPVERHVTYSRPGSPACCLVQSFYSSKVKSCDAFTLRCCRVVFVTLHLPKELHH